jgi:ArsR family transcriptional regulator
MAEARPMRMPRGRRWCDTPGCRVGPAEWAQLPTASVPPRTLRRPDVEVPARIAALLGDRTRAGILALLADGPTPVCDLARALGERPNNVSTHLARLREAGLVRAARHPGDSRWIYYERDEPACANALAALTTLLGSHTKRPGRQP